MASVEQDRRLPVRWWLVGGVIVAAPIAGRVMARALGAAVGDAAALIVMFGGVTALLIGAMFWLGFRHRHATEPVLPLRRFRDQDPAKADRSRREGELVTRIWAGYYAVVLVVAVVAVLVVALVSANR